ncbi:MAG: hypothetical protein D6782_05705 [Alphaproteobacteria bacterium]|nr:MAG: hypothetical protein D6782_05705 [Alphaproteobacteria bacterium]
MVCALFLSSASSLASRPHPDAVVFRIERKGATIGRHEVVMTHHDGRVDVDIAFKVRVKVAFLTVFKMSHTAHEEWTENGKLKTLHALTERSSGTFDVAVTPSADGYRVVVNGDASTAPANMVPTSFSFAKDLFGATAVQVTLLDTLSGRQRPSFIQPLQETELTLDDGRTVTTAYYEILRTDTGQTTHRIWVDAAGNLLKLGLFTKDDQYIEYYRVST